jgi:hypothetical protein
MYDAVELARDLSAQEAEDMQHEQAAKLKAMREAEYGRCIGIRHAGHGRYIVFVGMQDGAPLNEWPRMRDEKKPRRTPRKR